MAISKEQYRLQQEAFVSNHGGTTPQEIIFTLVPNIFSILLTSTTLGVFNRCIHRNVTIVMEFALSIIPNILCCTVLSEHVGTVCIVMTSIIVVNIMLLEGKGINFSGLISPGTVRSVSGRRPFVTNFRALVNIVSTTCILAVDFRIFPRKFAKTEVFGYSLMDTGVGLFILANALVAPESRDFSSHRQAEFWQTLMKNMKNCLRNCVLLLILGLGRFVAVEYSGYQKHVTEYGIHWNFFITLAVVKLFTSMITSTVNSKYSLPFGIWILGMHEYIMSTKGLKQWVLGDSPRDNFISANREGLVSVPGYIGLYFIGIAIGRLIHSTYQSPRIKLNTNFSVKLCDIEFEASYNESMLLCIKLSLISAQACIAMLVCETYFKVSRRLANIGYCMWILTLTTALLTLLLLSEIMLDIINYAMGEPLSYNESKMKKSRKNLRLNLKKYPDNEKEENKECVIRSLEIFEAVNYNGLFFFLFSNLTTGLVNMLVYTLYAEQLASLLIIIMYMALSVFSSLVLYRLQIAIKL